MTLGRKNVLAAVVTSAAAVVCALVAALSSGVAGAVSAAVGGAVVVAFCSSGTLPLAVFGGVGERAGVALAVLLLTYTLRLAVALVVLRLAGRSDLLEPRVIGLTVIACALAWTGTQVRSALRAPGMLEIDPVRAGPTTAGTLGRDGA